MSEIKIEEIDTEKKEWAEKVLELIKIKTPKDEVLIQTICSVACSFRRGYTIDDILKEVRTGKPLGMKVINFLSQEKIKKLLALRNLVP